jgi:hypothetical protein
VLFAELRREVLLLLCQRLAAARATRKNRRFRRFGEKPHASGTDAIIYYKILVAKTKMDPRPLTFCFLVAMQRVFGWNCKFER